MYTMTRSGVLKLGDEVIPLDDSTPEYQAYAAWLAEGNGPQLVDATVYSSIQVTAWQLIQALSQVGLLQTVETAASGSNDVLIRMGWQRAPNFVSDDQFVINLASAVGVDRDGLQRLFELAMTF